MKILNSNQTNHDLTFIPRFTPDENLVFSLKNEVTKVVVDIPFLIIFVNGLCTINFDFTFAEKSNYQIKFTQNDEVVYRGKLFITSQPLQDYEHRSNTI